MSTNIDTIKILKIDAWMYEADRVRLLEELRQTLPEDYFLDDVDAFGPPTPEGKRQLKKLTWRMTYSGNSFYNGAFAKVVACIHGQVEAVVVWDSGNISGLRIVEGKMKEPEVGFTLGD